jgi:hypothetical protein
MRFAVGIMKDMKRDRFWRPHRRRDKEGGFIEFAVVIGWDPISSPLAAELLTRHGTGTRSATLSESLIPSTLGPCP